MSDDDAKDIDDDDILAVAVDPNSLSEALLKDDDTTPRCSEEVPSEQLPAAEQPSQ